jgi:hypothetical protein
MRIVSYRSCGSFSCGFNQPWLTVLFRDDQFSISAKMNDAQFERVFEIAESLTDHELKEFLYGFITTQYEEMIKTQFKELL